MLLFLTADSSLVAKAFKAKNIFLGCFLVFLSQTTLATNNVSKEYIDNKLYEWRQELGRLLEDAIRNNPGPTGPMGASGPRGEIGPPGDSAVRLYKVGDKVFGGTVFYVDGSSALGAIGEHGLVAAEKDYEDNVTWNGYAGSSSSYDVVTNAKGNGIGAGRNNTFLIIAGQSFNAYRPSRLNLNVFAAQVCANYCVHPDGKTPCTAIYASTKPVTGYADWYLPSLAELSEMWRVPALHLTGTYWSSNEDTATEAFFQSVDGQGFGAKSSAARVRCIRAF